MEHRYAVIIFLHLIYIVHSGYVAATESCVYPGDPVFSESLEKNKVITHSDQLEVGKPKAIHIPSQTTSEMTMNLVIPEKQESGWLNFSNILALLAFLLSIWSIFNSKQAEKKALAKSINDDFWMRTITIPLTIKHVMELATEGVGKYVDANSNMRVFFVDYYLEKSSLVRSSFLITASISPQLPETLNKIVDDLEDSLSEATDADSVAICLSQFLSNVVSTFKSVQFNL